MARSAALVETGALDVVLDATYRELSRLIVAGASKHDISSRLNLSISQVNRYISDPRFRPIYTEVADQLYGDVDNLIRDEKAHVTLRKSAVQTRALTVLANVLDAANDHISKERELHAGSAHGVRSTILKAAVDAARLAVDMNEGPGRRGEGATTLVNIKMPPAAAAVVRDTAREIGVIDVTEIFNEPASEPTHDASPTQP